MVEIKIDYILESYKDYLEKDFPDSKFLKEYKKSKVNKSINKLFLIIELIELYENHELIRTDVKISLSILKDHILRYIYILPLGDNFFYGAIVRRISEIILRSYILLFDSQKTYSDVYRLAYKNIKSKLNSCPESRFQVYSESLLFFKEQYSYGSKVLHGTIDINGIDYLYLTQRNNLCANIKDIEKFTNNILYFLVDAIRSNYNLKETDFSLSQIAIFRVVEDIIK